MKTASQEVRLIAIRAYRSGISRQQTADIVGYHLNSVRQRIREFEQDGRMKARPRGHRISVFTDEEREELTNLLTERVDLTLEEIRLHFQTQCSLAVIYKIVKPLGFVFKKTLRANEQDRKGVVEGRKVFVFVSFLLFQVRQVGNGFAY